MAVLNYHGDLYELEPMTIRLAELEEKGKPGGLDSAKPRYEFLVAALGKDAAAELLGESFETVSLPELAEVFYRVHEAYWGEVEGEQLDKLTEQLETLAKVCQKIGDVSKLYETASRQGFKRVK